MKKLVERSYFIRLALSFLALATLVLVLSSFVIYKNYENETIRENKAISEQMLSQTVYEVEMIWDWASMHAIEMYNNGYIFNAIYGNELSPIDELNAQTVLSYAMSSNPYIYSIYLYNGSMDKVVSTVSKGYPARDFYDQDILKVLENKEIYKQYHFIPRQVNYTHYDKLYKEDVISLIVTEPQSEDKPVNGALIMNIKVSTVRNLFKSFDSESDDSFIILDENGGVISHTEPGMFLKNLSGEDYTGQIKKEGKASGFFTNWIDGSEFLITYVRSDKLNWSFIRLNRYDKLFLKAYAMRNIIIILVCLLFLLIAGFSVWLSWKFYKPYNKAVENSTLLRRRYEDNKGFLRREFIKSLLSGGLPDYKDISRKLEEMDIKLEPEGLAVLLLRIDNYKTDFLKKNNEKDAALFKFCIMNIAQEIISSQYSNEAVDMGSDGVAIIINTVKRCDNNLDEEILELFLHIRNAVQEFLQFGISGALGRVVDNYRDLALAYARTLEISDYRLIHGRGSLVTEVMAEENEKGVYTYSGNLEKEIMDCLRLNNFTGIKEKVHHFFSAIQSLPYDDILMSLNRLAYDMAKTFNSMSARKNSELNYKSLWDKMGSMETLEEIHQWLLCIYGDFIGGAGRAPENVKQKHTEHMLEIIDRQYSNPNFSAEELAEQLNLSSNYVREVFRESRGISLSNYINEYRCKKACEMLELTNLTTAEISEKIGLSNQNYFFTLFKKFSGLTPQQYRNNKRDTV